jgi:hypothetical protein
MTKEEAQEAFVMGESIAIRNLFFFHPYGEGYIYGNCYEDCCQFDPEPFSDWWKQWEDDAEDMKILGW